MNRISAPDPASIGGAARPESLLDVLRGLAGGGQAHVSMQEMADALDGRSFGALLLLFSIPNIVPLPPGASLVLGLPLLFVAWQMIIGRRKVWLPQRLADYRLRQETLRKIVARATPLIRWIEALARPRRWPFTGRVAERLFGVWVLFLAVILVLPVPLGNWLPAVALTVTGLAFSERDGVCLAIGTAIGVIAALVFGALLLFTYALVAAAV